MTAILRSLVTALFVLVAAVVAAQETVNPTTGTRYEQWQALATETELALDEAETYSVEELEELRRRITEFRPDFAAARGANSDRIATLEAQLEALGAPPESGSEPEEVANQRKNINDQLEALRAPVRVADSEFRRSEGLIGEIDRIIRARQARKLLSLGPSPVDPRTWPVATEDISRILADVRDQVSVPDGDAQQNRLQDRLPLVLLLVALSLPMILRGRKWAAAVSDYMRRFGGRGTGVWSFMASLLRIFIPLAGIYLLSYALKMSGLFGPKIVQFLHVLPLFGLILLGFRWLAERLFAREDEDALLPISSAKRRKLRSYLTILSLLFVMRGLVDVIFNVENAQAETIALLSFPLVVMIGTVLVFMGLLMRNAEASDGTATEPAQARIGIARVTSVFASGMIGVGVVSPVMAGIGYAEAGNALLYPTIMSLLVLGLVVVLKRFLSDIYGLVTGQGAEVRDGLAAILIGFLLTLVALPALALVWGARIADLTELWTQFLQGFDIGGTRISPSSFLAFIVVFMIGYTVTRVLQSTLRQNVLPKTRIDIGGQNALVSGLGYVGVFLSALIAVTVAGLDLSGLAIVAGALSVGIGFGLQTIVSNFVSGIILLVERPISEGDWIEVGGQMGYVKHISVRSTRIETFDRTDVIIPNSDLVSGTVTNYTRGNTIGRLIVPVGVAYGTDTKKVDAILREIAEAQPMVLRNPAPNIVFMGFGADALDFEIRAILRDVNWSLSIRNDINHAIAARFAEEGIEIPFAQRDIWLRNPEALHTAKDKGE